MKSIATIALTAALIFGFSVNAEAGSFAGTVKKGIKSAWNNNKGKIKTAASNAAKKAVNAAGKWVNKQVTKVENKVGKWLDSKIKAVGKKLDQKILSKMPISDTAKNAVRAAVNKGYAAAKKWAVGQYKKLKAKVTSAIKKKLAGIGKKIAGWANKKFNALDSKINNW